MASFADLQAFQAADPKVREAAILVAIERAKGTRGLLSPAESVNAVTVGALHADGSTEPSLYGIDPYANVLMTNLASAVGLGSNRSVKPDLVAPGGRFVAACANVVGGGVAVHPGSTPHLGQMVAAPSGTGNLHHTHRTAGTSNATALMTRACHSIADAVEEMFGREGTDWRQRPTRAVILKALLAHGCGWEDTGRILESSFPPEGSNKWSRRRDNVTRFIGYGRSRRERVVQGDANRVTLLAEDLILPGSRHEYRLPVPPAMLNNREIRSVTLTLAWICPTTNRSTDYRGSALKLVNSQGKSTFWRGVERTDVLQPNSATAERGTLIHFVLQGQKRIRDAISHMSICVQATDPRHPYGAIQIPYALAITLELAQSQRSALYAQVREIVEQRARLPVAT